MYVWACSTPSFMMSLHLLKPSIFSFLDLLLRQFLHQIITGKNTPALTVNSFISQLDQTTLRVSTDVPQCSEEIDLDGHAEN